MPALRSRRSALARPPPAAPALLTQLATRPVAHRPRPGGADRRPFAERVRTALDDDLDVPRALDALDDLASAILSGGDHPEAPDVLAELAGLVGVDLAVRSPAG